MVEDECLRLSTRGDTRNFSNKAGLTRTQYFCDGHFLRNCHPLRCEEREVDALDDVGHDEQLGAAVHRRVVVKQMALIMERAAALPMAS